MEKELTDRKRKCQDLENTTMKSDSCSDFCGESYTCKNRVIKQPKRGDKTSTQSREDSINNEDFFMALTILTAKFSKDFNIAACLVKTNEKVVAVTKAFDLFKEDKSKEDFCQEFDILLKSEEHLKDCTVYLNCFPDKNVQVIVDKYPDLKKVIYIPNNGQLLESGKYKAFKSTRCSKIQLKPHFSNHLIEEDRTKSTDVPCSFEENELELIEKRGKQFDEYIICVCFLSGMQSQDPRKQVGACLVNKSNRIVGIGYNDPKFPNRPGAYANKYAKRHENSVIFAEESAICNTKPQEDLKKCRIYSTIFPGDREDGTGSVDIICESGIKEVIYTPTGKLTKSENYEEISCPKFKEYGVKLRPYMHHFGRLMVEIDFQNDM